jgi:hypothetical protein
MAFRYQKINPQSAVLPTALSTIGVNGTYEFNIPPNVTFNLSKSLLFASFHIDAVTNRYPIAAGCLSQFINRIQLFNSANELLSDIKDAYSYSANMMMNTNKKVDTTALYTINNNTQLLGDSNSINNLTKNTIASLIGDTVSSKILTPVLSYGSTAVNTIQYFSYNADFNFMYPKTLFSLDRDIHTKENLKIIITLNPMDLAMYFSSTTPATSLAKATTSGSIPEGGSTLDVFFINLYILPSSSETNFTVKTIEPEIQKILVNSNTNHNIRIMLKPNKDIGFITWSPYSSGYLTGADMFGNSLITITRNGTSRIKVNSYDLRLSGNPLIQQVPINVLTNEHQYLNTLHYQGLLDCSNSISSVSVIGFVQYITFDGRGICDFNPDDTSYLNSPIPLELTNDVILSTADTKSHQFMIGYRKTIKSENGILSIV